MPSRRRQAIASRPLATARTQLKGWLRSNRSLVKSLSAGLSSTINISVACVIDISSLRRCIFWQSEFESAAVIFSGFEPYPSAMLFDDFSADRQPNPVAGIFRTHVQTLE